MGFLKGLKDFLRNERCKVVSMMHVQGDVNVTVLERTLSRLREIEASQEPLADETGAVSGQFSVLEGMLIADM